MKKRLISLISLVLFVVPCTAIHQAVVAQELQNPSTPPNDSKTATAEETPEPQDIVYFDDERSVTLIDESTVNSDFWSLCLYFEAEQMLTYCEVASSVTTLNSQGVESPEVSQIRPHKMFTQDNLFTDAVLQVRRPTDVEKDGCTLDQLTAMLSTFDVEVKQYRADELAVEKSQQ